MSQQDPLQPVQPYGPPQPQRRRSHWVRNIFAGIGVLAVLGVILTTVPLFGGSSTGSTDAAAPGPASAPPSSYAAAPSPAATGACTTRACIAADAETLKGTVAKDNSVMTKVTCKPATVKQVVSGTYTVHCTATYSDGAEWRGIASVLTAGSGEVDWEPTDAISYGS